MKIAELLKGNKLFSGFFKRKTYTETPGTPVYRPVNSYGYKAKRDFSVSVSTFLNTPPKFILRGPIYLIFVIVFGAVIYSSIATTSDTVTAPLIVTGQEYLVRAPFGGTINRIYLNENDIISVNTRMLDVYSPDLSGLEISQGDFDRKKDELITRILKLNEYKRELVSYIAGFSAKDRNFVIELPPDLLNTRRIDELIDETYNKNTIVEMNEYNLLVKNTKIRLADMHKSYADNQSTLAAKEKIYKDNKELFARGIIAEPQFIASENDYKNAKAISDSWISSFKSEAIEILRQLTAVSTNFIEQLYNLNIQIKTLENITDEVHYEQNQYSLYSIFPGTVSENYVQPRQLVSQGMPLFKIIRNDFPRYALAYVFNKDVGKIAVGQRVAIKFDAFPYQQYGVQEGEITSISSSTKLVEGFGYVYQVNVSLDKVSSKVNLLYGASGLGEIYVGKRRLIELVIAPIGKLLDYLEGQNNE
jgi:multidrug efflux pump subunit AcrA (membrane-fusion protein)